LQSPNAYFRIANGEEDYYTRNGSFQAEAIPGSDRLALTTASGDSVLGADGLPITIGAGYSEMSLGNDGLVTVSYDNQPPETFQLGTAKIN
ncbi:flagellar hook-basal body protein, partial [Bacillus sp. SIMBA_161]